MSNVAAFEAQKEIVDGLADELVEIIVKSDHTVENVMLAMNLANAKLEERINLIKATDIPEKPVEEIIEEVVEEEKVEEVPMNMWTNDTLDTFAKENCEGLDVTKAKKEEKVEAIEKYLAAKEDEEVKLAPEDKPLDMRGDASASF